MVKKQFVNVLCGTALALGTCALSASAQSFTATATTSGAGVVGSPITIKAGVTNQGGAISNLIVDMGVYSARGYRVGLGTAKSVNFAANQTLSFTWNWVPSYPGTYTVRLRVFNVSWTTLYYTNTSAATFTVN